MRRFLAAFVKKSEKIFNSSVLLLKWISFFSHFSILSVVYNRQDLNLFNSIVQIFADCPKANSNQHLSWDTKATFYFTTHWKGNKLFLAFTGCLQGRTGWKLLQKVGILGHFGTFRDIWRPKRLTSVEMFPPFFQNSVLQSSRDFRESALRLFHFY